MCKNPLAARVAAVIRSRSNQILGRSATGLDRVICSIPAIAAARFIDQVAHEASWDLDSNRKSAGTVR
jgi:hypothetical protein